MAHKPAVGRTARFALKGHSGAALSMIEADGRIIVRKQAGSPAQSVRLAQQCDKLRRAHDAGVRCPMVLRAGELDGIFSFDMEYVPADSAAHAIMSGRELAWSGFLPQLAAIPALYRKTEYGTIDPARFRDKLAAIAIACKANRLASADTKRIDGIVGDLLRRNWTGIPASDCHGDLTLENVLVRADGQVVFIDFDVPEHSSWWLDIAKVFQDLHGHWCLRHTLIADPGGTESLNMQLAMSRAATRIEPVLADMIPNASERLGPLVAFHLLRTVPYASDPAITDYVLRRVETVLSG